MKLSQPQRFDVIGSYWAFITVVFTNCAPTQTRLYICIFFKKKQKIQYININIYIHRFSIAVLTVPIQN